MIEVEIKRAGKSWMYQVSPGNSGWRFFDKKEVRQATEQDFVIEYCKSIGASKVVIVS